NCSRFAAARCTGAARIILLALLRVLRVLRERYSVVPFHEPLPSEPRPPDIGFSPDTSVRTRGSILAKCSRRHAIGGAIQLLNKRCSRRRGEEKNRSHAPPKNSSNSYLRELCALCESSSSPFCQDKSSRSQGRRPCG